MGTPELVEIPKDDFANAHTETLSAISAKVPIIFQAASGRRAVRRIRRFSHSGRIRSVPGLGHQRDRPARAGLRLWLPVAFEHGP